MKINKLLTTINFRKATNRDIKYIVIHYVGADGGALDNCKYFLKEYRGASAHYFVGHKGEIWQSVLDANVAWHCGTNGAYKHPYCRNDNSIGIEMCCRKSGNKWYFEDITVKATIELVRELMKKYNIPASNIIRHYDVTGKVCPEPYVKNNTKHTWSKFLEEVKREDKKEEVENMATNLVDNKPDEYAEEAIKWALDNKILLGTDKGDYKLHSAVTRQDLLVFLYRAIGQVK